MLIIPIILFTGFFYFHIADSFKKEINDSNQSNLYLLQSNIDQVIEELKSTVIRISSDSNVQELFLIQNKGQQKSYQYVETLLDTLSTMSSVKVLNKDIHSIYLYNDNTKDIITSEGNVTKLDQFFDTRWVKEYLEHNRKIQILPARKRIDEEVNKNNRPLDIDRDVTTNVVSFIYPFDLYPNSELHGAMVINVYEDSMNFPVQYERDIKGTYAVFNAPGKIISLQSGELTMEQLKTAPIMGDVLDRTDDAGFFITEIDKKSYMITYSKSRINDLVYMKITNLESLFQQVNYFRIWIVALTGIILLVGALVAYKVSLIIYSPIKATLESLKDRIHKYSKDRQDELCIITEAVNEILDEDDKIRAMHEKNKQTLKSSYVLELIRGEMEPIKSLFPESYQGYVSLILSIDKYKKFTEQYSYSQQYYFKTFLLKIAEKVIEEDPYIYGAGALLHQDKIIVVVGVKPDDYMMMEDMVMDMARKIMDQTSVIQDFSISIGIGTVYRREDRIRDSFLEALETISYRLTYGRRSIITYQQLDENSFIEYDPIPRTQHILNFLKSGKMEDIQRSIDKVIQDIRQQGAANYEDVIPVFYVIINKTIEYLQSVHIKVSDVFEDSFNIYYLLMEQETIEDIQQLLHNFYEKINIYQQNNMIQDTRYTQKFVEIVQQNYMRSDLDINWLVDELGISYSHIRKIAKDNLETTFIDYLNTYRINRAKELLVQTEMTIKDVAAQVGYNNDQSFTRYFKKYEGVTPGEYRRNSLSLN